MEKSEDVEGMIEEAKQNGIPVVFVDSDYEGSNRDCYIGSDNYKVGKLAGEALAEATEGAAETVMVVTYENDANQKERVSGFYEAIQEYPGIQVVKILEDNANILRLKEILPQFLKENPDVKAIVCAEGASTDYCAEILKENKLDIKNYKIVCMDYNSSIAPYIRSGDYYAAIRQEQYEMGYQAVEYLKDLYEGRQRTETTIFTDIEWMMGKEDTENLEEIELEEVEWYVF